jgi:hypothetical protein
MKKLFPYNDSLACKSWKDNTTHSQTVYSNIFTLKKMIFLFCQDNLQNNLISYLKTWI